MSENNIYILIFKISETKKEKNLQILGEDFVKNNINKGKIVYNNKKYNLRNKFKIRNEKEFEIKIKMVLD